jgi:hypothetical protein
LTKIDGGGMMDSGRWKWLHGHGTIYKRCGMPPEGQEKEMTKTKTKKNEKKTLTVLKLHAPPQFLITGGRL